MSEKLTDLIVDLVRENHKLLESIAKHIQTNERLITENRVLRQDKMRLDHITYKCCMVSWAKGAEGGDWRCANELGKLGEGFGRTAREAIDESMRKAND